MAGPSKRPLAPCATFICLLASLLLLRALRCWSLPISRFAESSRVESNESKSQNPKLLLTSTSTSHLHSATTIILIRSPTSRSSGFPIMLMSRTVGFLMAAAIIGDRAALARGEAGCHQHQVTQAPNQPTTNSSKTKIIQPTQMTSTTTTATMTLCDRFPFLSVLAKNYQHQPVFLQAVEEMAINLESLFADPTHGEFYQRAFVAMTEPERTISFRVPWEDDDGTMHWSRGWRVEFNRYSTFQYVIEF